MKISSITGTVLLLFISAVVLNGQTTLSSLDEIAAFGSEHNLEYKNSQINVLKAAENRTNIVKLENSSISAAGNFNNTIQGESWRFSSTILVPLIEQLSLSGTIEEDLSGQVGISLKPLAHSDNRKQSEIDYNSALITAESARISVESDAMTAALNWMFESRDLQAKQVGAELAEIKYKDDKIRYDIGEITLDNLQNSLISWSEARILLSSKQQSFRNAESHLYSSLGAGPEDISIKKLDIDTLYGFLKSIKQTMDDQQGDPLNSNAYRISLLNVYSAKTSLDNTWIFDPDLNASVNLNFTSDGTLSVTGSIGLSLSPGDYQKNIRDIARKEFQISISEAEQSRNESKFEYEQILESLKSAEINSEISQLEYQQAQILLSEAELLQRLGDYSEIELQESQLTLSLAENALFRALADEYIAWLELKSYM